MHSPLRGCRLLCREPFQKGLTSISELETQAPTATASQGREAHEDSLSSPSRKPGTDRDLIHFPNPYTRSESWWLSFALFPQLTWVSQSIQDPARAAEGFSVCSPCSGSALPRRKVSLTFPCAPCSRERSTQTWSSAQPVGNHPHRTQPAASYPPSGSLSISIHRAQHPQPLCASHHPQTPTQREGCTRTPAMGLWLPTINTQVSSRLQTPDCCKFCRLNQDQLITSCPHLKSYVVQTKFPEGHLPLWLWPTHSRL